MIEKAQYYADTKEMVKITLETDVLTRSARPITEVSSESYILSVCFMPCFGRTELS
jgi:hypothetical protein